MCLLCVYFSIIDAILTSPCYCFCQFCCVNTIVVVVEGDDGDCNGDDDGDAGPSAGRLASRGRDEEGGPVGVETGVNPPSFCVVKLHMLLITHS